MKYSREHDPIINHTETENILKESRETCDKCKHYRSEQLIVPLPVSEGSGHLEKYNDSGKKVATIQYPLIISSLPTTHFGPGSVYDAKLRGIPFESMYFCFKLTSYLFNSCINPSFQIIGKYYDQKNKLGLLTSYFKNDTVSISFGSLQKRTLNEVQFGSNVVDVEKPKKHKDAKITKFNPSYSICIMWGISISYMDDGRFHGLVNFRITWENYG